MNKTRKVSKKAEIAALDGEVLAFVTKFPGRTTSFIASSLLNHNSPANQHRIRSSLYRLQDKNLVLLDFDMVEDDRIPFGERKVLRAFINRAQRDVAMSKGEIVKVLNKPVSDLEVSTKMFVEKEEVPVQTPAVSLSPIIPSFVSTLAPLPSPSVIGVPSAMEFELPEIDTEEAADAWARNLLYNHQGGSGSYMWQKQAVTPTRAAMLLRLNTRNRKLCPRKMAKWKRLFEDRIVDTCDAMGVDKKHYFFNGQHRLHTCINTGISFCVDIKVNMEEGSDTYTDVATPRGKEDTLLTRFGITQNRKNIADTANWILLYRLGLPGSFNDLTNRLDSITIADFYEKNQFVVEAAQMGGNVWKATGRTIVKNLAGAAYFLAHEIDARDADLFFDRLLTGVPILPGVPNPTTDPILLLRNKLIALRSTKKDKIGNNPSPQLAMVIFAWNAWRKGKTITKDGFRIRAKFPTFI